jgi:hypothetical protein
MNSAHSKILGLARIAIGFLLAALLAATSPALAQFEGGGGSTGIALEVADWVPERDPDYGGWGVVPAGGDPASPLLWTADAPSLELPAGTYDVYWVQDFNTRDQPMLLAEGVTVGSSGLVTVQADSGVKLAVAGWVPPRDPEYGWWGAVPSGGSPDALVNWTKTADALLLPPGTYDVYWAQEFITRDHPVRLASGVRVEAGEPATVRADTGLRLNVADWVPPRDPEYGWWGAVPAGSPPDQLVNWTHSADAILLPPGDYDVYWAQEFITRDRPVLLASGTLAAGEVKTVEAISGVRLETASWVPARDPEYGWWGAVEAGAAPDALANWTRTADALLLPPGEYDVYWAQSFATRDRPILLAGFVNVPNAEFGGIGIELTLDGDQLRIVNVQAGSPAEQSGILAGDVVLSADGQSLEGLSLTEAVSRLRGAPDTPVALTVKREGTEQPIELSITRAGFNPLRVIRADSGIRAIVASDVPPLDPDTGWWGAAREAAGPDARINWTEGSSTEPLLLPPGRYDIYWQPSSSEGPQQKAAGVEIAAGELVEVAVGTQSIAPSLVVEFGVQSGDDSHTGAAFAEGIKQVRAYYSWRDAPVGHQLGVRWYKDDEMILEQGEPVAEAEGRTEWILKMQGDATLPVGSYRVELVEADRPPLPLEFTIGAQPATAPSSEFEWLLGELGIPAQEDAVPQEGATPQEGSPSQEGVAEVDDFSDPSTGWASWTGSADGITMGYVDGTYQISVADGTSGGRGLALATNGDMLADGRLSVEAINVPGSVAHPNGIFLRGQDALNFHAFIVASNGSDFLLFHLVDGSLVPDGPMGQPLRPGLFRADAANLIEAVATGAQIAFLLNGEEVARIDNAVWPSGQTGLLVANASGSPAGTAFDNWRLESSTAEQAEAP